MSDEVEVVLCEEDFVEAYKPAPRPRRLFYLTLVLALMLTALIIVLLVRFPDARTAFATSPLLLGLTGAIALAALILFALVVAIPTLRRKAARSTLRDHPGMQDPVHYEFDDEQFAVRSTFASARYPWSQLWDWRETDRVIIVMPTPRNFYLVPKSQVDADILDRLRQRLAEVRRR